MKLKSLFARSICFLLLFSITTSCDNIQEITKIEEIKLIKIETTKGDIMINLYNNKAPETVKNFLYYAENGLFDGTIFHRVIKNFMIQGGGHLADMSQINTIDPVVNESNNNLSNKKGTISMARTNDPHSATSQFFINLIDNEFLDKKNAQDNYGYCVFGEVVEGIDVVENIGKTTTTSKSGHSDVPVDNIIIKKVQILD